MFRSLSTAVLLLLLALPGVALAQGTGTLAGRVLEADGVTSVIGATVRIDGTSLGARTNIDGDYRIIGVPVGTYAVSASFVGLESQTITDVDINAGQTRQLSFTLASGGLAVDSVGAIVEYRVPLITTDPSQARTVTGEDLESLPIRDVAATVALQGGIINTDGSNELNIRGGRSQEVQYFVDGVRVTGSQGQLGVNQQAIEQQEVLIGAIPARYGDVQSGVISITTKTGRNDFFGSVEGITSTGLDSFGYNLGSISLGGPILKNRLGFFFSAEGQSIDDASPFGADSFQLREDVAARVAANPQLLEVITPSETPGGDPTVSYIDFPNTLVNGRSNITRPLLQRILRENGTLAPTDSINGNVVSATEQLTEADFDQVRGKNDPVRDLTLNGNLNFTFGDVGLRLGAGYVNRNTEPYSFLNSFLNGAQASNPSQIDRENVRFYGTLRQRISNTAFYQLQGEYTDYRLYQYPQGFSNDISEVVNYGRPDQSRNDIALRYYSLRNADDDGSTPLTFAPLFDQPSGPRPGTLQNTFRLPGAIGSTVYQKRHEQQARFSGSATAQIGVNQIEFGGEYQQETNRRFVIRANGFAQLARQADGSYLPYDSLSVTDVRGTQSEGVDPRNSYGYNFNGTEEVDAGDQNINGFFPQSGPKTDTDIAPYRPLYYAGYVQDKIEFQDLIVSLGLRVDVFDNNSLVLRDIFAPEPIVRAADLISPTRREGFPEDIPTLDGLPAGIDDDYAVYFNGGRVVGYRDLDGNFFDTQGGRVNQNEILEGTVNGSVTTDPSQSRATSFVPYDPQVTVMPRIGVSFPVTDRALFFASYNVTSQRPTEFAFAPIAAYDGLTGQAQKRAELAARPRALDAVRDRLPPAPHGPLGGQPRRLLPDAGEQGHVPSARRRFPGLRHVPQRRLHDDAGRRGQLRPPPNPEPAAERELHALVRPGHGLGRPVDLVGSLPRRPDPAVPEPVGL